MPHLRLAITVGGPAGDRPRDHRPEPARSCKSRISQTVRSSLRLGDEVHFISVLEATLVFESAILCSLPGQVNSTASSTVPGINARAAPEGEFDGGRSGST